MQSPLETYKKTKEKDKLRKESYTYFNNKYFMRPYQEYDFLEDDERFLAKKLRFFIPGRIYTWKYDPLYKDVLDYYDTRPMVLVHSEYVSKAGNRIVQGLNLNFLPELARVQTLDMFWKIYKNDIKQAEESVSNNMLGVLRNAWQYLSNWFFTINVFNKQANIGYQWAYRNYIIPRITQPVLIELEDWDKIPYFVPKEFKQKSPAEIWSEYVKYRNKLSKYTPDKKKSDNNKKKYKKPGV